MWSHIKERALREEVVFRVVGDRNEIEFHLRPDFFPNSFVLAWTTPEERDGNSPYLDCRCRSVVPDNFLSRITFLTCEGLAGESTETLEQELARLRKLETGVQSLWQDLVKRGIP